MWSVAESSNAALDSPIVWNIGSMVAAQLGERQTPILGAREPESAYRPNICDRNDDEVYAAGERIVSWTLTRQGAWSIEAAPCGLCWCADRSVLSRTIQGVIAKRLLDGGTRMECT